MHTYVLNMHGKYMEASMGAVGNTVKVLSGSGIWSLEE